MRHIAAGLVKLFLFYCLLTVIVEVALANYHSSQASDWVHVSCAAINRSLVLARSLQLEELSLVRVSLWVFHNRVHYILLALLALVGYYSYRDRTLQRPTIGKNTNAASRYEQEKAELTRQKVEELKNSQEYQDYVRQKNRREIFDDEDDREDVDWEKGEKEIFDD